LDPARAELHRHAHVQPVDPVLALEVRRAGEEAVLVEHDRVDHLRGGRAGRVPRRRAEQLDQLAAALGGAFDHRRDPVLRNELRQRHAADRRRGHHGHHLVAVAAEHHGGHVLDRGAGLPGDEGREAGRVEDAGHAEDALLGTAGRALGHVTHRVERVRDDDQDRVRRGRDHLLGDLADDLLVRGHEVVAAHPGRAWQSGSDHDYLRARGLLVAVRADDVGLVAEHRAHLVDVERLALRQALLDVDEHDVPVVPQRQHLRTGRADVPGADDRHRAARAHETGAPSASTIASATSLVPTAVGSSRVGFMSYVTFSPVRMTSLMAPSSRLAASVSSRWRSISIPESIIAIGFTLFWPAYFGADPWVGSKIATSSPKLAPGAIPSPPIIPAARSETMSP